MEANSAMLRSSTRSLRPQFNSAQDAIVLEEQLNLLEGDPIALMDEAIALHGEERRRFRAYLLMESERNLLFERSRRIRERNASEARALRIEASREIDYWMKVERIFRDHIGGNGYNNAFTVPMAFSVANDPGQRNLFLSSSRGGAGYAATQYSSFAIGLEQQSVEDRPNRAIHFDHPPGGIESSITSNGANGAEAWARWQPICGQRFFDGNGYNSPFAVPMAFSVGNDLGQRNLVLSSSRGGAGYAGTQYSSFETELEQQSVEDRLNSAIHFDRQLARIESSITSNGTNGAEARAGWSPVLGHRNSATEPMAFLVRNSPGQRSMSLSSYRGGTGYTDSSTLSNEDVRIPIDDIIDGRRTGYGRQATGNTNKLNHPGCGAHTQEGTGGWGSPRVLGLVALMGLFGTTASFCWDSYSGIKEAFGTKWAPVAFAPVWLSVAMLGAGIICGLFDKSRKPKAFTKYALVVLIFTVIVLFSFVWGSMIRR